MMTQAEEAAKRREYLVGRLALDFVYWGEAAAMRVKAGVRKWGLILTAWTTAKKG